MKTYPEKVGSTYRGRGAPMVALVAGRQLSISCPHPTSLCSATFPKGEGFGGEGKALVYNAEWLHCRKGGRGCVPPPTGRETRPLRGATQNACHSEPAERVEESTHEGRQSENDNAKILRRGFALLRMTREWDRLWQGESLCPTKVIKIISGRGALVRLVRYLRGSMNSVWAGPSTKGL